MGRDRLYMLLVRRRKEESTLGRRNEGTVKLVTYVEMEVEFSNAQITENMG